MLCCEQLHLCGGQRFPVEIKSGQSGVEALWAGVKKDRVSGW
jgi:hypothetical protein